MKRFILIFTSMIVMLSSNVFANEVYSVKELAKMGIVANSPIAKTELENAKKIMLNVQAKNCRWNKMRKRPFLR